MRRRCILLIIVSILILNGCKRKEGVKEEILLRWSGYGAPGYNEFRREMSRKFEKAYPGIKVRYEPIAGGGYETKIMTLIAGGTAPDIFFIPGDTPIDLARRGALLDLTPYIKRDKSFFDKIYPSLMKAQEYKGKIYALPNNANVDILYYNRGIFDTKGVKYPDETWAWDSIVEGGIRLTIRKKGGQISQIGFIPCHYLNFIIQNGGKFWDSKKTKCIINNRESINAFKFIYALSNKYHISPTRGETLQQKGYEMFMMGRAAMLGGGRWYTAMFKVKGEKELKWSIAVLPKGKIRASRLVFNSMGVLSTTRYPELSYKLAKFMIQPEGIRYLIDIGDSIPIRYKGENVEYFLQEPGRPQGENNIHLKMMQYAFTNIKIVHPDISYSEQREMMIQEYEKFILGKIKADQALNNLEKKLNKLIRGNI